MRGVMRHRTLIAGILGVALVVSAYLIARHTTVSGFAEPDKPRANPVIHPVSVAETEPVPNVNLASERAVAELRAMSPTFRNSTFLITIRRAGYYRDAVVSATESAEGGWVASCGDKGGYTLSVRTSDGFEVRPIGSYLDGIAPALIPRDVEQH